MKTLIFILLSIISSNSYSQKTGTINGVVKDYNSKELLYGVKIKLSKNDSTLVSGAMSDLDGRFTFKNVSYGHYILEFSYPGYEKNELLLTLDTSDVTMNIDLITKPMELLECVVVSDRKASKIQSISLQRIPGVVGSNKAYRSSKVKDYNTESYNKIDENKFRDVKTEPLSTFSIDVDRASYSNVRRYINSGSLPPPDAVRIEELINYFPYNYPAPSGTDPFSVTSTYTSCPWNDKHQLLHIGLQGKLVEIKNAPANNLVFLIDVSGSMNSPDKLDLLKSGLYLLVDQMRENDRIAIVVYAGAAGLALPSTSGYNKNQIKSVIEQLEAGGSTAGGQGIELAYQTAKENFILEGNNRVIMATDGDFNVGISSEGDLIRLIESKRENQIYLSVLGFGSGNLQDSKMEKMADRGNGNYNYIDNILEAKKVLVDEMGGTLLTIAKDVKLQLEFNPKQVQSYRLIGYENRLLNNEDFNDDSKDAGDMGSGHSVTAVYEIVPYSTEILPTNNVDPLKYQSERELKTDNVLAHELATLKIRYKKPGELKSKLSSEIVSAHVLKLDQCSDDLRFTLAVIEYGMILRSSELKGTSTFDQVLSLMNGTLENDKSGYRKEFYEMVEKTKHL